jgi:hypothetical protein
MKFCTGLNQPHASNDDPGRIKQRRPTRADKRLKLFGPGPTTDSLVHSSSWATTLISPSRPLARESTEAQTNKRSSSQLQPWRRPPPRRASPSPQPIPSAPSYPPPPPRATSARTSGSSRLRSHRSPPSPTAPSAPSGAPPRQTPARPSAASSGAPTLCFPAPSLARRFSLVLLILRDAGFVLIRLGLQRGWVAER